MIDSTNTAAQPAAKKKAATPVAAPGEIHAGAVYTLSEFAGRFRLGKRGMRSLRARGLRVVQLYGNSRAVVLGSEVIRFVEQMEKDQHPD